MKPLPRTIYKYLGRELVLVFLLALSALTLISMIVMAIQAVHQGFQLRIIMPWIMQSAGYSLYFTVPIALLVSTTLTYGRVVADKEYTAIAAAGISPLHLFAPMGALSLALCLLAFVTQGTFLPRAHYIQRNIARYLVKQLENLGDARKGRLPIDQNDGVVLFDRVEGGTILKKVQIEKKIPLSALRGDSDELEMLSAGEGEEEQLVEAIINAEEATVTVERGAELVKCSLQSVDVKLANLNEGMLFKEPGWAKYFESCQLAKLDVFFPINDKRKREGDWTNAELVAKVREYTEQREEAERQLTENPGPADRESLERLVAALENRSASALGEIWQRRTMALSFFVFAFLGFPLSVTLRHRHRLVPFFIGTMLVIGIYYPLLMLGGTLCENYHVPAAVAMLSGNMLLLGFSVLLTGKLLLR